MASIEDLKEAIELSRDKRLNLIPLGQGSNVVVRRDLDAVVVRINLSGKSLDGNSVRVAAGESWHEFVDWSLAQQLYGLENLALIPGTVGAAPIQNIGAYGVELNEFVSAVSVVDTLTSEQFEIDGGSCDFAYRSSRFQREPNLIVTAVTLDLKTSPDVVLTYPGIQERLASEELTASPRNVFQVVSQIRLEKLPNPAVEPNVGSFFKNPIVPDDAVEALRRDFAAMPLFPAGDRPGSSKLSAAWLIDQADLKQAQVGGFHVSAKHALVIVNRGEGKSEDLLALIEQIQDQVQRKFGIALEPEPGFLPKLA